MLSYLIRRLLLVLPTFILITLVVFTISRFMPGGPVERAIQASAIAGNEKAADNTTSGAAIGEDQIEKNEEEYGFDKPIPVAYLQWLGGLPKETKISKAEYSPDENGDGAVKVILKGTGEELSVSIKNGEVSQALGEDGKEIEGWSIRIESEEDRQNRYAKREQFFKLSKKDKALKKADPEAFKKLMEERKSNLPKYDPRVVVYKKKLSGLLQGNFGESDSYGDKVITLIWERMPIAAYFGLLTAIIVYCVSIPLGVVKAIQHRTPMDTMSSILIFIGYSIPGWALGAVLVIWMGARWQLFPLFGLTSSNFESLNAIEKIKDLSHHTVLPLLCYVIGGFAYLTMLMKNNLMENLAADYVKTAISRGSSFHRAVFGHALKNSLIPIATSLGGLITIFVSGSLLIERVFDIQGFGLLQYNSVISKDIPLVMGTLTFSCLLMMIGNIISDVAVAAVDPRIKFK